MCITPKNSQKTGLNCGSTLPPKANPSTELAKSPCSTLDLPNFITRLQKKWRKGENNHGTTKSPTPLVSYKSHHLPVNVHGLWIQRSRSVPPLPTMQVWVVFVVLSYGGNNASCWVKAERKPWPTAAATAARRKLLRPWFLPAKKHKSPTISLSISTHLAFCLN